jgi:HEAT repeat protein
MMQGIRHGPERAAAPDWQALADIMRPLARDPQAGCRRWAVRELGILRDPRTVDELISALEDEQPLVRSEACTSLSMLGRAKPATREPILTRLKAVAEHDPAAEVRTDARRAIAEIS